MRLHPSTGRLSPVSRARPGVWGAQVRAAGPAPLVQPLPPSAVTRRLRPCRSHSRPERSGGRAAAPLAPRGSRRCSFMIGTRPPRPARAPAGSAQGRAERGSRTARGAGSAASAGRAPAPCPAPGRLRGSVLGPWPGNHRLRPRSREPWRRLTRAAGPVSQCMCGAEREASRLPEPQPHARCVPGCRRAAGAPGFLLFFSSNSE